MMNDFQASTDLLKKLKFQDLSETSVGNLGIDLQFKNKFKKDFISVGIDCEKMQPYINCVLMVSNTLENIERINKINDILNELVADATCQKWLGR